jgi:hypothetical protein
MVRPLLLTIIIHNLPFLLKVDWNNALAQEGESVSLEGSWELNSV